MKDGASSITSTKWFKPVMFVLAALVVFTIIVLLARWMRELPAVQSFMTDYPGTTELPEASPIGFPAWLSWQHFLNVFFIVLIIRSGWLVRTTTRPPAFWTRNNTGLIRTKGAPRKISLHLWFHLSLAAFWLINGVLFIILLFPTGQWMRIVPLSWDVFPNAVSVAIQYTSLNWPTENGWVSYNSLQLLAYFVTVFIAAPLAFITGVRMSGVWPRNAAALNKLYPIEVARAIHFPVMLYFVLFTIVHVTLVLATGALRNLNHMYGGSDTASWVGFGIFAASIVVMVAAWLAASPVVLRSLASLTGSVTR